MEKLILALLVMAPLTGMAKDSIVRDPIEFSESETGYECELGYKGEKRLTVGCRSEVYLGDAIECDEDYQCDIVYDVPKQEWCALDFSKISDNSYEFIGKSCEVRRVEE